MTSRDREWLRLVVDALEKMATTVMVLVIEDMVTMMLLDHMQLIQTFGCF